MSRKSHVAKDDQAVVALKKLGEQPGHIKNKIFETIDDLMNAITEAAKKLSNHAI